MKKVIFIFLLIIPLAGCSTEDACDRCADDEACFEWDRRPHRVEVRPLGITRVVLTLPVEEAPSTS